MRCPKCGATEILVPPDPEPFAAIAQCGCCEDCAVWVCLACGYHDHVTQFEEETTVAKKPKLYCDHLQDAADEHPTLAKDRRHLGDVFLRDAKPPFQIEHRAPGYEPIWSRRERKRGRIVYEQYTQTEAIAIADAEALADLDKVAGKVA